MNCVCVCDGTKKDAPILTLVLFLLQLFGDFGHANGKCKMLLLLWQQYKTAAIEQSTATAVLLDDARDFEKLLGYLDFTRSLIWGIFVDRFPFAP